MPNQFSVDSIDYLAEKLCQCRHLCDESLIYLAEQISSVISTMLQDATKVLRKRRRKSMNVEDFQFALRLHQAESVLNGYITSTSEERTVFRKIRKDNRILYQIEDRIVELDELLLERPKIPLDIGIRVHWLAIGGQQPNINENPIIQSKTKSKSSFSSQKQQDKLHILSTEQQIYFKQITELCLDSDDEKRKSLLSILSSDDALQQIIDQLILFISEGIRVNIASNSNQSIILKYLLEMCDALLVNDFLSIESHLHYLFPSVLSCVLFQRIFDDHWSLRDFAAKTVGQIIRKYSTATNRLQQRTINVFYRILIDESEQYNWSTQYGALIGLCELGAKVIVQIVFPLLRRLGERLEQTMDEEIEQKIIETVVKSVTMTYRSTQNDCKSNEKKLYDDFGPYFAPLIQHQLILLL